MYIYICIQSINSGGICGKKTYYSFSIVHVAFCFIYVCSPNVIALVLGFFETLRHNVPKYYCRDICVFIWCGVIGWLGVTVLQTKPIACQPTLLGTS